MDDSKPDTLRACEACGGNIETRDKCTWCTGGFQNFQQQTAWRLFRSRMRKISGTYDFLVSTVESILEKLDNISNPKAKDLKIEGTRLLREWELVDPVNGGRNDITNELKDFMKRTVDFISEHQT